MPSQSASAASGERVNRASRSTIDTTGHHQPRVSPRGLYRVVATAEMLTWALLITAMIGKYALGAPDWTMRIAGSIHGFVFLSYVVVTVLVAATGLEAGVAAGSGVGISAAPRTSMATETAPTTGQRRTNGANGVLQVNGLSASGET